MSLLKVGDFCRSPRTSSRIVAVEEIHVVEDSALYGSKDPSSVVLVPSFVLKELSLFDGNPAWLEREESRSIEESSDRHPHRLVVSLCLVPESHDAIDVSSHIWLSPLLAANLGCHIPFQSGSSSMGGGWVLQACLDDPIPLKRIVLKPVGCAPDWPSTGTQEEVGVQMNAQENWTLPPPNMLVQPYQLLSVREKKNEDSLDRFCFFQVLHLAYNDGDEADQQQEQDDAPASQHRQVYRTTCHTEIELDLSPRHLSSPIIRLPNLIVHHNTSLSSTKADSNESIVAPPHPNLEQVRMAMSSIVPACTAEERVLHVVGTDQDHHLQTAVKTAAHQLGFQCFAVKGLGAYAHHCGHALRGSAPLIDQLTGLKAATESMIEKHNLPCVLHLYDFDEELMSADDEEMRRDQEDRFWNVLMANLTPSSNDWDATNRLDRVPGLIVVVSTKSALKSGPLLQRLVFPSIELTIPDASYTNFLWGDTEDTELVGATSETPQKRSVLLEALQGRGADEIVQLHKKCQTDGRGLSALCADLDKSRRKTNSGGNFVAVKWEDVGGLEHVRSEIMDAIELPLKHPHLFPQGGRSGLLLYGPPGTGKTLVAKAVATECSLPFFSVKGPELLGSYVGESESNVREVFASARRAAAANKPTCASVVFFDELDSLAPRRGAVGAGGGVMDRIVSTLFSEMDLNSSSKNRVFVLGATNRPDLLDPSLLRPGRLDRLVYLGVPTAKEERARVLCAQLQKVPLHTSDKYGLAAEVVDRLPVRLTGADMSAIVKGATLAAVERLCLKADMEAQSTAKELEAVLDHWSEGELTPKVTLQDFLNAAEEIIPSVSESQLKHYEHLRDLYSGQAVQA